MAPSRKHVARTNGHKGAGGLQALDAPTAAAASLGLDLDGAPVREGTYTTTRGETIEISGVSPWLLESLADGLRAEWAEDERGSLEPPTYDIPLPGGDIESRPHDLTTLKTDEDRAEWEAYQARLATYQRELQERSMRVLLMRGVKSDPPAGGRWEAEQKFMGIRVPQDEMERRYHWVKTELISSPAELVALMNQIMGLSGIREEALRAANAAFRSEMEESEGPKARRSAAKRG